MQKQNLSKNTAKCSKSAQRDFNRQLGGMTQDQSLLKTAGNCQNWQNSQEFTNLGMNGKRLEEFESQHRPYPKHITIHTSQKSLNFARNTQIDE